MADGSLARFISQGSNQIIWLRLGLILAGINGAIAVAAMALAYHGGRINPDWLLHDIDQAARLHIIHALAILALAGLVREFNCPCVGFIMLVFTIGIICFCGGLYALGFYHAPFGLKIAPYGGMAFIFGWVWLGFLGIKHLWN